MSDLSAYLAAAVLLGLGLYRLATDRDAPTRLFRRYAYGLLICLAAAMALLAPATPGLLAGAGTGGVALIMLGDGVRTAAISLLMFLVGSLERRSVRGLPLAAAVGTQAVMITLFLVSRPTLAPDGSVLVGSAGRWSLAAHDLVFAGYAEWTVVFAARALRREAGRTRSKPVRIGLRLFVAACAVGVVWSAWTADDVVDVLRSGAQNGSEDLVSNALGALCTALIVAGALGVKGHALFTSARIRYRAHRTYRQLAPLWEALCAELPQLALEGAGRASLGLGSRFHDLDFALYRRVIEIHDGRLALRPYAPERNLLTAELEPARRGRGLRGVQREVLVEAASIAAALDNHRAGRALADGPAEDDARPTATVSGTMEDEAAWLAQVSTAFSRMRS